MTGYKLELNFEADILSIVANDKSIMEDNIFIQYVNIPNDNFCVMRVNGIDPSDNEFKLISNVEFYKIVYDYYIEEFKLMPEKIKVSYKEFKLEYLSVNEINCVFDSDLCSFSLYEISVCN